MDIEKLKYEARNKALHIADVSRSCGVSGINSNKMGNMSYCRFENTYRYLQDCYDALSEAGSIKEVEETANQYEKKYIRKLVELCKDIVDYFGDENEEEDYYE